MKSSIFCPRCGTRLNGEEYCPRCQTRVDAEASRPSPAPEPSPTFESGPTPRPAPPQPAKPNTRKTVFLVIAAIIAIAVCGRLIDDNRKIECINCDGTGHLLTYYGQQFPAYRATRTVTDGWGRPMDVAGWQVDILNQFFPDGTLFLPPQTCSLCHGRGTIRKKDLKR